MYAIRSYYDRGADFVEDRVVGIDAPGRRLLLASGNGLDYDIVSFNTGSGVPQSFRNNFV